MAYQIAFQSQAWPMVATALDNVQSLVNGRVYYQVAPRDTAFPVLIYQSQDNGGSNFDHIDQNGWQGLVTLRCAHTSLSGAFNILTSALNSLCTEAGHTVTTPLLTGTYTVKFIADKPQSFPTDTTSAALIYQVGIVLQTYIT